MTAIALSAAVLVVGAGLGVGLRVGPAAAQTPAQEPADAPVAPEPATPSEMDTLFEELAQTEGEDWAAAEGDIMREWSRSGSAVADLLLKRGFSAMDAGDTGGAIGHLTALTDYAPDFAPGWAARAEALYLHGQTGPAAEDLRHTLLIEPRYWPAITQLATMLEEMGDDAAALAAYRHSLSVNPHQEDARDGVARLLQATEGQAI